MLGLRSKSKCGAIGLDIGSDGLRVLQLRQSNGSLSVVAAARWHFPPELAAGADGLTRRRLGVQAARELLRNGSFRGRRVVSCLRSDQLAVKNVRLPHMSEAELDKAVLWECQECFGFPVAPDRLHYLNAGEVRQGSDSRDEIILLAVAEETLREHLQILAELRLRPEHVDAEPMALFRAFRRLLRRAEDENTVSVIVDVGLASTRVVIARGTTVLMIKNLDVAGRRFNESVARELGLSYAEAAHTRRRCGQPETGSNAPEASGQVARSVVDAIRGQVEALAREIALCLRYCSVTFRGLRAEQITLTGGEAYDPALVQLLGEHLGCRCVVGAPLRGVELEQADMGSDRRGVLTEWSVAAGLALRGLPGEPGGGNGNHAGTGLSA